MLDIVQQVANHGNELIVDGRRFKLRTNLIEQISSNPSNVKGLTVDAEDGFQLTLTKVDGTHNNWQLQVTRSPYDAFAESSGIEWDVLDQAWLDLSVREGFGEMAQRLREGTLPSLDVFEPGPVQDRLRDHYIQLAKRTAEARGMSQAEVENAVASLFASDPITASKVLLNQGGLDIAAEVARAHSSAQERLLAAAFESPEQIQHFAHVYVAAGRLPEAERDALRQAIEDRAVESGKTPEFRRALEAAGQVRVTEHVDYLNRAYADARGQHGDTTAVTELGRIVASALVHELRADADRLIQEKGTQGAYATLETRFQDEKLIALPEPLQQAVRVAIVGELGRINSLHVLATKDATTFGDTTAADAQLLGKHKDDLVPFLSASIQKHGVGQTLLRTATAVQQRVDESERQALLTAVQKGIATN